MKSFYCWVFNLLNCCHPLTDRVNQQVRTTRHRQRCHPLQALERGRKASWLPKTPWTPPVSARHLLYLVRTPSLLWFDVSNKWTYIRLTKALIMFTSSCDNFLAVNLYMHFMYVCFPLPFSASESGPGLVSSSVCDVVKETAERLPQVPLQEHVFSECSRERILGLLAAMLPPAKPVRETRD